MSTTPDDLDAVKQIVAALSPFPPEDQERILRWTREKLGLTASPLVHQPASPASLPHGSVTPHPTASGGASHGVDIKSFVGQKQPASDNQFAAAVAFYYSFEAPEKERKPTITKEDLLEACRKVNRKRLSNPGQTLLNAAFAGLLDKGDERGTYKINSVGENLVAMTLPGNGTAGPVKKARKKVSSKKSSKKTSRSVK